MKTFWSSGLMLKSDSFHLFLFYETERDLKWCNNEKNLETSRHIEGSKCQLSQILKRPTSVQLMHLTSCKVHKPTEWTLSHHTLQTGRFFLTFIQYSSSRLESRSDRNQELHQKNNLFVLKLVVFLGFDTADWRGLQTNFLKKATQRPAGITCVF